ncbi:MAG: hypothetical protein ACJAU4_001108 [Glaciecola sp.]
MYLSYLGRYQLLTDAVKNLNASNGKVADKIEGIEKHLVRIETMA